MRRCFRGVWLRDGRFGLREVEARVLGLYDGYVSCLTGGGGGVEELMGTGFVRCDARDLITRM